jgi:hypothetical protein
MATKIDELTALFFRVKRISAPGQTYVKSVSRWVEELVKENIPSEVIEEAIKNRPEDFKTYARARQKESANNVLKAGRFYYHPFLQIAPPAPVIKINDDGSFSKKRQDFFLKIKSNFSYSNVLEYFYTRFPYIDRNVKRDIGAIDYLYTKVATPIVNSMDDKDLNAIDLLLFTIDTAAALCQDTDVRLTRLLSLSDYANDGLARYLDKRETSILAGVDHVV